MLHTLVQGQMWLGCDISESLLALKMFQHFYPSFMELFSNPLDATTKLVVWTSSWYRVPFRGARGGCPHLENDLPPLPPRK